MMNALTLRKNVMEALLDAETLLTSACSQPNTGTGRRVRDLIWSIYGDSHRINLCECLSSLDSGIADAVVAAVRARAVLGGDCEEVLRRILDMSGEFARWDDVERRTPQGSCVNYPPA